MCYTAVKPARDPISHVSQQADVAPLVRICGALCELGSNNLTEVSDELKVQLEELRESLAEAETAMAKGKEEVRQRDNEISQLQQALAVEKQKVKKIWREKCDQQLAHEELLIVRIWR